MQRIRLSSALLFALTFALLPLHIHAQAVSSSEQQVRQWMNDFKHAFEARDTKAIMALYAPDVIAYDVTPPLQYVGKASYTKDWAGYFAGYKGPMHIEFRDCHISSGGDIAIFFCLLHVNGTLTNGKPASIWLRNTTALRQANGHWLDFHDHVSIPADFATGKALDNLHP